MKIIVNDEKLNQTLEEKMKKLLSLVFVVMLAGTSLATVHDVEIVDFSFSPSSLTVNAGDTVRWTNHDNAPHTTTSDTDIWDSGTLTNDQSYEYVFSTVGNFPYYCAIHPSMTASVLVTEATDIEEKVELAIPENFGLNQNFPNPFNAMTTVSFSVAQPASAVLGIYDITGRLVETLYNGSIETGEHSLTWNATDYSTGIYFYRLTIDGKSETRAMALLK